MKDNLEQLHQPVLVEACAQLLSPALNTDNPVLVDATIGMGGHSKYLAQKFSNLRIIGIDRDPQAREIARQRLAPFEERVTIVDATYDEFLAVIAEYNNGQAPNAVLADLGVSSLQLDDESRGFSYVHDGPLDMRMDQNSPLSAAELIDKSTVGELTRILREYGEEKFAHKIALALIARRDTRPVKTTQDFAQLIKDTIPAPARRSGGNPAKRSFQALRIAVNNELQILRRFLFDVLATLPPGARFVVESYQSLEDRLVKQAFSAGINPVVPRGLPVLTLEHQPWLKALTKGAQKADETEIEKNPRAASVRLRAVEVLQTAPKHWQEENRSK